MLWKHESARYSTRPWSRQTKTHDEMDGQRNCWMNEPTPLRTGDNKRTKGTRYKACTCTLGCLQVRTHVTAACSEGRCAKTYFERWAGKSKRGRSGNNLSGVLTFRRRLLLCFFQETRNTSGQGTAAASMIYTRTPGTTCRNNLYVGRSTPLLCPEM